MKTFILRVITLFFLVIYICSAVIGCKLNNIGKDALKDAHGSSYKNAHEGIYKKESKDSSDSKNKVTKIKISCWSFGCMYGFKEAFENFNQTNNQNIQAILLNIPQERYDEVLNILMTSGEGPDIIGLNSNLLYSYISRQWILDLSKYIDSEFLNKFPDWVADLFNDPSYYGKIYAIPSSMITFRLIYNKDIFKAAGLDPGKPPKTMDQLKEYACHISRVCKGDRKYGFAIPLGEDWVGFVQSVEAPATHSGIYFYDYKNDTYNLNIYEKWFETILEIKKHGGLFPGETTLKPDYARVQFAEGNIGMMFASSWEPAIFTHQYTVKCDWGVAMPPAIDKSSMAKGAVMMVPGSCYAINDKSTNSLSDILTVWKYLYSEDFLSTLYKNGSEVPIFGNIISDYEYDPHIINFYKFLPSDIDSAYPNTPKGFDEWSRMKAYLSIFKDNTPTSEALLEGSKKLNIQLRMHKSIGTYPKDEYIIKDFDPLNPLKK